MPNWSTNHFVVFGDKKQLEKFYADMQDAIAEKPTKFTPVDNSWDNRWVGNLFLTAGYSEDEVTGENRVINCRGGVISVEYDDETETVVIDDYTAWEPNSRSMNKMLDEKYPGLLCVYRAEIEGARDCYINSDLGRYFITDEYAIDCWCDGGQFESYNEFYEDKADVLWAIADITGVDIDEVRKFAGGREVNRICWMPWVRRVLNIPDEEEVQFVVKKFADDWE